MSIEVELVESIPVANILGEGVLWRETDQTVWWTDIQAAKLFKLNWYDRAITSFDLPERLGSFGFVAGDDSKLVCAFESGFALYQPETEKIDWLAKPPELTKGRRLNDGRVAPDGSFWAGSMIEGGMPEAKALDVGDTGIYRLSGNKAKLLISGISISNGIAWVSEAGTGEDKGMYFSDSVTQKVHHCDSPTVAIKAEEQDLLVKLDQGSPDGAVVDAEGRYWSAVWGESCLRCFSSEGELLTEIPVPAFQPTCISFGGAEGNLLFVTSATEGLDESSLNSSPRSGDLFVYKTNVKGVEHARFNTTLPK